jgi:hypothetical protein
VRIRLFPRRPPWSAVLALAALFASFGGCENTAGPEGPPPDVTAAVERLGNPFTVASPYARNVWDMQLFRGRIYLGHGDSIDNWGPIPIWSLDPAGGRLAAEFTADEEQVDVFRVLGGSLYVPGHDPRDDWTFGNLYRLDGAGWVKLRTIPHGLHAFDVALHDGKLVAALGTAGTPDEPTLLASEDGGLTWTPAAGVSERIYGLFELMGMLYAEPLLRAEPDDPSQGFLLKLEGGSFTFTRAEGSRLLPGLPRGAYGRMVRPTAFAGALVYVVAANTFDWIPAALAVTTSLTDARRVALPDPAAVPFDLLVRGGTLHVLAAARAAEGGYTVSVYSTGDLESWRELFHFHAAAFARSFEEQGGDFYFGLGSTYNAPSPATGDLLRVRRASYASR